MRPGPSPILQTQCHSGRMTQTRRIELGTTEQPLKTPMHYLAWQWMGIRRLGGATYRPRLDWAVAAVQVIFVHMQRERLRHRHRIFGTVVDKHGSEGDIT